MCLFFSVFCGKFFERLFFIIFVVDLKFFFVVIYYFGLLFIVISVWIIKLFFCDSMSWLVVIIVFFMGKFYIMRFIFRGSVRGCL